MRRITHLPYAALVSSPLPLFPLNTPLVPGLVLPLHIFEPRYVAMVRDALAGDRALAIVMLKDDGGAMEPRAEVYDVACAGVIIHAEQAGEDRFNILVHGLERVRLLDELPLEHGYRRFRTQMIPPPTENAIEQAGAELARLQSCVLSLRESVAESDADLVEVMRATPDPIELADILSAVLVSDPLARQRLLATTDLGARLRLLIDGMTDVLVRVAEPERAKMN